jgi:hypothetical protein
MIPCDRIAYALFYAMRIKVSEEEVKEVLTPLQPIIDHYRPAENKFKVKFFRDERDELKGIKDITIDIEADNESDALTRAKFVLETDEYYGDIKDIQSHELSITS